MTPPEYFHRVASSAKDLWAKLEDPVLAGPWKQLFAQVQSPRHVLSELLQNADDAGAKKASVGIVNNEFAFEHDGEDFNEEQFQSLCRFGYSNKRNLHTIGFRGVGFKSTFSLGERVRIQTPTLDLCFDRERFTLPVWGANATPSARTRVSVRFADTLRERQLRMNFEEWATSPVSLLFFRNLQELAIESHTVRKDIIGSGPIARSQRIRLTGASTEEMLLICSAEEAFPEEVMNEIRQERNADDLHLPPCSVELVLGLECDQRLFVVLPAGTDIDLTFSINAPFLQDPARQKIKEPEVSPCNRWLLERAGRLAGEAMAAWLEREDISAGQRADAYDLLRGPVAVAADLKTVATKKVLDAMLSVVQDKPVILTTAKNLAEIGKCTALPKELHQVWDMPDLNSIFAMNAIHLLSPELKQGACKSLAALGWIETVSEEAALQALRQQPVVPTPVTWTRLRFLWEWVQETVRWDWTGERRRTLRIVPIEGQPSLQPAKDVIRVSSRGLQLPEDDWNFISNFALAIDQDWITHLNTLNTNHGDDENHPTFTLLKALGLHEPSQMDRIAAEASRGLQARGTMSVAESVRIAHIFAALDATVPNDFRYVTEDLNLRQTKDHPIVFDADGGVEGIVPRSWAAQHLLHPDYVQDFNSCTEERWFRWAYSVKSRLHAFVPLTQQATELYSRQQLGEFLITRGGESPIEYHYRNDRFIIDDFDFPAEILNYWQEQVAANPGWWAAVAKGLLADPLVSWKAAFRITVRQMSTQRSTRAMNVGSLVPAWLLRLRSLPCLADRHGTVRTPPELLLRTADTETLLDLEPFVAAELDDTGDKKALLRWLGVRDTATGWEKVVERLRGLMKIKDTMRVLADVLRLYEALDRVAARCSPDDLGKLRSLFTNEPLVLSNTLEWLSSRELSLHADFEDDSPVVHSATHGLALWLRLGVPERPVLEKSLEWLKTLEAGTRLEGVSYKRATVALTRGGRRVWEELGHWLSLDQTWEAVTTLKYRVSMRNLTRWEKLAAPTKRGAADLRMLHGEVGEEAPFTVTRPLAEAIAMQVTNVQTMSGPARRMEWLRPLAEGLCRVKLRDEAATVKVREVARRLLNTTWQTVSGLEVTPYIDGTPAGEPLMPKVLWSGTKLYMVDVSTVRLMRDLKEELTRPFGESGIMEAVADCIDRDAEFVREYLAAHFELEAQAELPPASEKDESGEETTEAGEGEAEREADEGEGEAETEPEEDEDQAGEADDGNEGELPPEDDEGEETAPKPDKPSRPKEPTFMDRYARGRGFRWHEAERCYTHANGAWIDKGEAPFHWQEHLDGSQATKRLFVVEESLRRGVEIPFELWRLMEINPDSIALVLCGDNGEPNEWSASELQKLKAAGQIHLHQSRFILKETSSCMEGDQ